MRWLILVAVIGCSRAAAPEFVVAVDADQAPAVDVAEAVSPADAPSAVTP
jgi:hypothetical protein